MLADVVGKISIKQKLIDEILLLILQQQQHYYYY